MDLELILPHVTRPARYTDHEWNAIRKDHLGARARFVLAYPDVYEVGMSHLGLRILYHVLNSHPDFVAERVFCPWGDMAAEMREGRIPLASLESGVPVREFDALGVTLPYELTYTNILELLDLAGIPLAAAERGEEDPLVIGGGPGAANPEPVAEFFDAIALGDGEEVILEIADVIASARGGRRARIEGLARIPGVYVPSLYEVEQTDGGALAVRRPKDGAAERVCRRLVRDFDEAPYPTRQVVPFLETVHDRVVLEIMRGCGRGCRFCQAGRIYRPPRYRRVETLLRQAEEALAATGYDEVSLLAFTTADHPQIQLLVSELIDRFGSRGVGVALPSLRADQFRPELAQKIQEVRKTGLTFAPEAGSQRLREMIGKDLGEEDLFAACQAAFSAGWNGVKLYFMLGLPTETEEDVEAIGDLVRRVGSFSRREMGGRQGRLRISVSATTFVPKAHTPFQWWGQEDEETLVRRQNLLQSGLRSRWVKLAWSDPAQSLLEAAIGRGDRRLSAVIRRAWELGCRFDAWSEQFDSGRWEQAFSDCGLEAGWYAQRRIPAGENLPWDHLDFGVSKELLVREARAAGLSSEGE
jgi:radical SAM family uncharacterized protein